MSEPDPTPAPPATAKIDVAPKDMWWGRYVLDKGALQYRLVIRWGRIAVAAASLSLFGYFALATALWSYYTFYRNIPGINWTDVAVLPRFSRVQSAIGDYYFSESKRLWEKKDFVRAIITGRAAVLKAPQNLEARLFLADCWLKAGRVEESVQTLRGGIEFNAGDPRLQKTLVQTFLTTARYTDLLKLLRVDLPARGVRPLDGTDRGFQLAELKAVLASSGAVDAASVVASHKGLAELPAAAPLLAQIDWESGQHDASFARLKAARDADPKDPGIQDAYVDTALRLGNVDEARAASKAFLQTFPNLISARLRFLEAHGSRQGEDRTQWMDACTRYLIQFSHQPAALAQLGDLASSQGWSDLAYLLYQDSLNDNLTGFPFAIYYVGSLIKSGDFAGADKAWHELSIRNSGRLASVSYFGAMVASGSGRESEALQIVDQIRRATASDPSRRRDVVNAFRRFGFPKIADELGGPQS